MSTNSSLVADTVCRTEVKFVKASLLWTIENFGYCPEIMGEFLESPTFTASDDDSSKWSLMLYPRGSIKFHNEKLSLQLKLDSCESYAVGVIFVASILSAEHKPVHSRSFEKPKFYVNDRTGFSDFIDRNSLLGEAKTFMCGNDLTIFCQVTRMTKPVNKSGPGKICSEVPENRLSADLGNLLKNQVASDVVLISSDDHEFPAHKAVLAARSSVFAAMFQADMIENARSRVEIADLQHRALQGMLQFVYTGEPPSSLGDDAQTLLVAADKYDLDIRLKAMCEKHLISNLTADTAAEVLILADMVGANRLKEGAVSFIKAASAEVTSTAGWKNLVMNRFDLVLTLFPCCKG